MTDMVVDMSGLVEALQTLLSTEVGCPVGDTVAPLQSSGAQKGNREAYPYIVIQQGITTEYTGPPFVAPEADSCINILVVTYGLRPDQVRAVASKIKHVLIGRVDGHGIFLHDLTFDGHSIMQRSLGFEGRIDKEGTVFSKEDLYEFRVTSQV